MQEWLKPFSGHGGSQLMRQLMFHERVQAGTRELHNASLRELDQSWRLLAENDPGDFAVLVGDLVVEKDGTAEEVSAKPGTAARL